MSEKKTKASDKDVSTETKVSGVASAKDLEQAWGVIRKITIALERILGIDINRDGVIGKDKGQVSVRLVAGIGLLLMIALSISVYAGARTLWSLDDAAGNAGVFAITTDDDGTSDLSLNGGALSMGDLTTSGDIDIDGGDITAPADLTITPAGGDVIIAANLQVSGTTGIDATAGDYIMENDEILRNDVNSDVEIIFADTGAILGQLIIDSSTLSATMAANDLYEIIARAQNDSAEAIDYITLQLKILDETTNTEDSAFIFQGQVDGTETTIAQLDGANGLDLQVGKITLANDETIDNSATDDTVTVASGDASLIFELKTPNTTAGSVTLAMTTDNSTDAGDDTAWLAADGGTIAYQTDIDSAGTLATKWTLGNQGLMTLKNGETVDNSTTDDTVTIASDDAALIVEMKSPLTSAGNVTLKAISDNSTDAGDDMALFFEDGGTMSYQTDADSAGTLATKLSIDKDGLVTLDSGETINNNTTDDTITVASDDASLVFELKTPNDTAGSVTLRATTDNSTDAGDDTALLFEDGGTMSYQTDIDSAGTLATKLAVNNQGIVTLKNGEQIDNATADAAIDITFDDDATTLGVVRLESTNPSGSMSAGDQMEIVCRAQNDSAEAIDYATIQFEIIDETTNTEDAAFIFTSQVNGTATTAAQLDAVTGLAMGTALKVTSDDIESSSRNVVISKDATTIYAIESGTCTNGQTVTFTTAFSSGTPVVILTYQEDAGVDTVCEATSITTTNFACQAAVAKDVGWMAMGVK